MCKKLKNLKKKIEKILQIFQKIFENFLSPKIKKF